MLPSKHQVHHGTENPDHFLDTSFNYQEGNFTTRVYQKPDKLQVEIGHPRKVEAQHYFRFFYSGRYLLLQKAKKCRLHQPG